MINNSNEEIIHLLTEIREHLIRELDKKYTLMDELKKEIEELRNKIHDIENFITKRSFTTAADLFDTAAFIKPTDNEPGEIKITRKIFSEASGEPAVTINFDGNDAEIYFMNPRRVGFNPMSEEYVNLLISPFLALKEKNPKLEIILEKQDSENRIVKMRIKGIDSVENLDKIFKILKNAVDRLERK